MPISPVSNLYWKITELCYRGRYNNDNDCSLMCKCLPALAFLLTANVIDGFEELDNDDDLTQDVVIYFNFNYVKFTRE